VRTHLPEHGALWAGAGLRPALADLAARRPSLDIILALDLLYDPLHEPVASVLVPVLRCRALTALRLRVRCDRMRLRRAPEAERWAADPVWATAPVRTLALDLGAGLSGARKRPLRLEAGPDSDKAAGGGWAAALCAALARLPALRTLDLQLPMTGSSARRLVGPLRRELFLARDQWRPKVPTSGARCGGAGGGG
jgi:hypothetical protein